MQNKIIIKNKDFENNYNLVSLQIEIKEDYISLEDTSSGVYLEEHNKQEFIKALREFADLLDESNNNRKEKFLDAMIDVGILKSWIPIRNDKFEANELYASFIDDVNITKWQEIYKGHNISYEIKGKGLIKAIHFEITKIDEVK